MALKILHPRLSEAYYYPIPTPVAYHVFAQQARREYAFTSRPIRLSAPVDADHSPKRPCLETTETTNYKKYICMRLYDAQDLQEYFLNRCELEQWLSYEEALTIIFGVIEAIIKLHRQQIIHSDIKFENILIQSGTLAIYLIDFDFCIGNGESTPILGTKEYLHPELRSQAGKINAKMIATPFNDIYAFAVMLSRISTIVCELTLKKYLATFKDDLRRSSSMECIRAEFIRRFGGVRLPIADEKQFYLGEGNKLLLNLQS
jgi:serine/threonine protein kinase